MRVLVVVSVLFGAVLGCRDLATSEPARQEDYVLRLVIVSVPDSVHVFDQLERCRTAIVDGIRLTDVLINNLLRSREAKVTDFPLVYINSGQSKTIDEQRPGKYANAWDSYGRPTNYYARCTGQKIDVAMFEVTNGVVETTLYAQDVGEPTWKKYPEFKYTIKAAYFPVMDFPFKDLHFPLDSWVIWPCGIQEKKHGRRREVFAALKVIQRQPPNTASHGTGYARP